MYNSPSDYSVPSIDRDSHNQLISSNNFDPNPYRGSAVFNNFLVSRPRQATSSSGSAAFPNDPGSFAQSYNMTAAEVFGTQGPILQPNDGMQSTRVFEYLNPQHHMSAGFVNNSAKSLFANVDPFGTGHGSALLQSHQVSKPSISQSSQQPQHSYHPPSGNPSQPYINGIMHTQSQTPYGPHVTSNGVGVGMSSAGMTGSGSGAPSSQEEISTIFVVGFPEDMQEREFQNMFTFSSGFEAATLKIPNKDSTAYGPGTSGPGGSGASGGLRAGSFQLSYPQSYAGSNDPYNLVTMNQGGVVVDGRDGTTSSWPAVVPGSDDAAFGAAGGHPSSASTVPPRKQIIGFAKFRTRNEALAARDVLQGRRVDIEKGAVLKAEMAKKNLHTKRGVGPLGGLPLSSLVNGGGGGSAVGTGNGAVVVPPETLAGISGLNGMAGIASPVEALSARERELGALGAMGLGVVAQRRERLDAHEEERERERESRRRRELGSIGTLGGIGIMSTRGPRERAEDDEWERERRRKEKDVRLRSGNSAAFDAFHSVNVSLRNSSAITSLSNTILSPTEGLNAYTFSPTSATQPFSSDGLSNAAAESWNHSRKLSNANVNGGPRPMPSTLSTAMSPRPPSSHQSSPPDTNTEPPLPQFVGQSTSSRSGMSDSGTNSAPFSPTFNSAVLPSHPSLPSRPRPFSPTDEISGQSIMNNQSHLNMSSLPTSSSSSVASSQDSGGSSIEGEMARTMAGINISTHQGMISPQLPSPGSGGSSGTRGNASDQNPPINTLYVGNLPTSPVPSGYPPNYLEESLRSLFLRCPGYRKLCFRQKSNGPMCFVEFEDVSYATKALNELYGHQLNGLVKGGIRLSYSKNPLGVRTPTNAVNGNTLQQQQQQAQQAFGTNVVFGGIQDPFSPRQSNDTTQSMESGSLRAFRRDPAEVASPTSTSSYHYAMSPPPRFISPPPLTAFTLAAQTNAHYPRSNSQGFVLSPNSSVFSPFGISSSQSTPHLLADESSEHLPTCALSSTPSIEAARAG